MQIKAPEHITPLRNKFEKLLRLIRKSKEIRDYSKLRSAFDRMVKTLGNENDQAGQQEIISAMAISEIAVKEIGLGMTSVLGIFLIRVFKKKGISQAEIEKEYGKPAAVITLGLNSIYELGNKTMAPQAENFRNLLLNLAGDVRVILIKIAAEPDACDEKHGRGRTDQAGIRSFLSLCTACPQIGVLYH
jgi:guanosine-3',5'-bis(diphosphate) 3'-pyrophosphohydrolase